MKGGCNSRLPEERITSSELAYSILFASRPWPANKRQSHFSLAPTTSTCAIPSIPVPFKTEKQLQVSPLHACTTSFPRVKSCHSRSQTKKTPARTCELLTSRSKDRALTGPRSPRPLLLPHSWPPVEHKPSLSSGENGP